MQPAGEVPFLCHLQLSGDELHLVEIVQLDKAGVLCTALFSTKDKQLYMI